MGGCGSKGVDAEAQKRDEEINKAQKEAQKADRDRIKLLLLGM